MSSTILSVLLFSVSQLYIHPPHAMAYQPIVAHVDTDVIRFSHGVIDLWMRPQRVCSEPT
jgi:hypothetical protein